MKTIQMTVLNQRPSEVVKMVEDGETVQVTRHGRPILRLIPEPATGDPLDALAVAGLLTPARSPRPVPMPSEPLRTKDQVDAAIRQMSADTDA